MKVIAKASESTYICEVSHDELEKFMDQYYGKMQRLQVGDAVNLGQGYDFASRIETACREMTDAMKAFESARKTMTAFALAIAERAEEGGAA